MKRTIARSRREIQSLFVGPFSPLTSKKTSVSPGCWRTRWWRTRGRRARRRRFLSHIRLKKVRAPPGGPPAGETSISESAFFRFTQKSRGVGSETRAEHSGGATVAPRQPDPPASINHKIQFQTRYISIQFSHRIILPGRARPRCCVSRPRRTDGTRALPSSRFFFFAVSPREHRTFSLKESHTSLVNPPQRLLSLSLAQTQSIILKIYIYIYIIAARVRRTRLARARVGPPRRERPAPGF